MAIMSIEVQERSGIGKNKVDKLRNENLIPGVIYSRGQDTKHIQVDRKIFEKLYKSSGMSTLINLDLEGSIEPVLIKEVQTHPFKDIYYHVDFQKLNMDEKVNLTIPIILINREKIEAQPSIVIQQLDEVEIACLPADIPESIEVDVSGLDFDSPIFISDLDIVKSDEIEIFRELDDVIANLIEPTMEEELDELEEMDELGEEIEDVDVDEVPVVGEDEEDEDEKLDAMEEK